MSKYRASKNGLQGFIEFLFSNSRFDIESFLLSICFFQALRVESKTSDNSPEKKRCHAKFNLSCTPSRQKVTYRKSEKNCEQKTKNVQLQNSINPPKTKVRKSF